MPSSKQSGAAIAIVDGGPLYAAVAADDDDHAQCVAVLERADLELVVPALVVAEATYLIGRRLGPKANRSSFAAWQPWKWRPLPWRTGN